MESFDVLIIGGGPAGTMTGIELRKKGYKTCIIDKEAFPREKLCGGLLTQKSVDLITRHCPGLDPSDFVVEQSDTVDFFYQGEKINRFRTKRVYYFTERTIFDDLLIRYYLELGGKLLQQVPLKIDDIHFRKSTLTTGSSTYNYKYLVGADGCNSVLCKAARIKRHDFLCVEGKISRDLRQEKELRIYFNVAKRGYGWYFPRKEYYCVGMGGEESGKKICYRAKRFFREEFDQQVLQIKGAFLPSGRKLNTRRLPKNTIPVGDAAGFTDPVTGEGLYFAMLSGILAAGAIDASAKSQNKNVIGLYNKNVLPIWKNIRAARFWKSVLFFSPFLKTFMKHLKTHTSFALFYLERVIATGEFDYTNFLKVYFLKIRSIH